MRPAYDLNRMIAAAASLAERVACGVYEDHAPIDENLADSRLSAWRQKSSQGNAVKFERRLSWENLDIADARRFLSSDPDRLEPAPVWAGIMGDMLAFLTLGDSPAVDFEEQVLESRPFAHAIAPLVKFGIARLEDQVGAALLPKPVAACLRVNLLDRITEVCALTLGEEFLRFRTARGWTVGQGGGQKELYTAFISHLSNGGLVEILTRYPVLARLVAIAISQWVTDMAEFLIRLEADRSGIGLRLFDGKEPAAVRSIQSSLSDPHRGGRTVNIVTFDDGRKIVYKPKSLAVDEAWINLIAWLREHDSAIDLRTPSAWDRGEYGWVEYIEAAACENIEGFRKFYYRAGMLICLFYAVLATDFHHENLIASGDHPVPIDLETLFVPRFKTRTNESDRLVQRFLATVLQSLMLPSWQVGADRKTAFDTSGLGSSAEAQDAGAGLTWVHINTDAMQFTSGRGRVNPARNMPSLPGESVDPGAFLSEISDGFARAYRSFMWDREGLLDRGGPLEAFRRCYTRIVLRPTQTYANLLRRSLSPRLLQNGIDRSLEFEGLSRTLLLQPNDSEGAIVYRAEVEALEQLDTPYFDAVTESDMIRCGEGMNARGLLVGPSFDDVAERFCELSEADLEFQAGLIRTSFAARDLKYGLPSANRTAIPASEPVSPETLVAEAEAIAARIASHAIWQGNEAYWIAPDHIPAIDRYSLQPIGTSLYSGRGGIAVFLAALSAGSGNPEYRRLALGATRSIVREWLASAVDAESAGVMARALGIGGATGIPGVTYALVTTARLLRHPDLLDDAQRISRFITPRDIEADDTLDVIGGAAGAILGLLPLWRETGDRTVYDRIVQCGEHLADRQIKENGYAGGWMHKEFMRPLTGFSHGAAGISYALVKAYSATGIPRLREVAQRGFEYERSVFVPSERNWPDFRPWRAGTCGVSWCHGAPGIGLARLGGLSFCGDEESRHEIDSAVQWLLASAARANDHLCCGEFGNLELFLEGGRRLGRADLTRQAQIRGASAIARANHAENGRRTGFQTSLGPCDSVFTPGLFDGLAGIGYQMLRLAFPSLAPSVLLWE